MGWQPQRFTLAIVGPDGRLVPFAAYDGGRWEEAWPGADDEPHATPTLDNVPSVWRRRGDPVPLVWQVRPATGGSPVQAHVKGVDNVEAHCGFQVALTTDLPAVKWEHPLKYGVAADSNLPIGSIEEVPASDVRWKTAARAVVANFSRLESGESASDSRAVDSRNAGACRADRRALQGSRVTSVHRCTSSPKRSTARIGLALDPGCKARTIVTGWLVPTGTGTLALRNPNAFLTECDGKEVRRALPLAAFRVSGRVFWVIQEHGYEDETYGIAEIGPSGVRYPIMVNGGGC